MADEVKKQEEFKAMEQESKDRAGAEKASHLEESPGSPEEQLAQKDLEIGSLQDRLLRMAAEMDNTRKRLERERSEGICFANESFIRDLLPVVDNLERALEHGDTGAGAENLLGGVQMTLKSFLDLLARYGCKPFDSKGKPFDPNFHEAMMQEESEEQPENTVLKEFQKGYTLNDRLLRPAMVIVARSPK